MQNWEEVICFPVSVIDISENNLIPAANSLERTWRAKGASESQNIFQLMLSNVFFIIIIFLIGSANHPNEHQQEYKCNVMLFSFLKRVEGLFAIV